MDSTPSSQAFLAYVQDKFPHVESWLSKHAWQAPVDAHNDLATYLYTPLEHFTKGAGKRVRPILCLLGCEAVGGSHEQALSAACAIEIFQSAALIHDDIADHGKTRRGEPCLHLSLGTGLAINVGDAALVQVINTILQDSLLDDYKKVAVLQDIVSMERYTLDGQALDLGWVRDNRWDITPDDYLFMATRKTAYYSCAYPLVIGAKIANGTKKQIDALNNFGLDAGLAFQIADDLLNLVGSADETAKDFRSDITEGKRTFAVLYALQTLTGEKKDELLAILNAHTKDEQQLARAVELMDEAGAIAAAKQKAQELINTATCHINTASLSNAAGEKLISMAHYFISRTN